MNWDAAIIAAVAMVIQDLFGVARTQAEARNHAWLTAHFDSLLYFTTIATSTVTVTTFQGHSLSQKILVVVLVTIANYIGCLSGVWLGRKFIKETK